MKTVLLGLFLASVATAASAEPSFDLDCRLVSGPPPHHLRFSLDFDSGHAFMTLSNERTDLGKFLPMTAVIIVPFMPDKDIDFAFNRVTGEVTLGTRNKAVARGSCRKAPFTHEPPLKF